MTNALEFFWWSVCVVAAAWMLAAYPQLLGVMVVSTEPLTDVIDPNTRSMRTCAEICDLQYLSDCRCYSALRNDETGQSVFMVEEGIYNGPISSNENFVVVEEFFSILTDFEEIDTLQITQYDRYENVMENVIERTIVPMEWIWITALALFVVGVLCAIMVPKSKTKGITKYRQMRDELFV